MCAWLDFGKPVNLVLGCRDMVSKRTGGFTLLEVLVVLLIVSLVTTLLVQGISMVLSMRYRFVDHLNYQQAGVLQSYWFRQVCMGFTPDQPGGDGVFVGTNKQLHGLTLVSLQGETGVAKQVDFNLDRKATDMVLTYRQDDGRSFELASWPASQGGFYYLDGNGHWHDQWPPPVLESVAQLPVAVQLKVDRGRGPLAWLAAITARRQPRSRIMDDLL